MKDVSFMSSLNELYTHHRGPIHTEGNDKFLLFPSTFHSDCKQTFHWNMLLRSDKIWSDDPTRIISA